MGVKAKKATESSQDDEYGIYESTLDINISQAHLNLYLEMFGDHLAEREGYRELSRMDAVHFYIVQKFKWLPATVRAMTCEDLRFLLTEEMRGWTVPAKFRGLTRDEPEPRKREASKAGEGAGSRPR